MLIKVFAITILIVSFAVSYILQKRCAPGNIKFKGKNLRMPETLEEFEIHKVFIKNGKYFAQGTEETGELHFIQIDQDVMANVPAEGTGSGPLLRVMVYKGANGLTLAEPEIRYKLGIECEDNPEVTQQDFAYAEYVIWFLYEFRNVFWTIATIGVWRSPHISIFFSLIAMIIQIRNVVPLRFEKLKKCDIIMAKEMHNESQSSSDSEESYPPGYDMWSENQKFLYHAGQRIANSHSIASEEAIIASINDLSSSITNVTAKTPPLQKTYIEQTEALECCEEEVNVPFTEERPETEAAEDPDELSEWVHIADTGCFEQSEAQNPVETYDDVLEEEIAASKESPISNLELEKNTNFFDSNRPERSVDPGDENVEVESDRAQGTPLKEKKSVSTAINCCKPYENVYGSPPKRVSKTAPGPKKRGRGAGSKNGHDKDNTVMKLLE